MSFQKAARLRTSSEGSSDSLPENRPPIPRAALRRSHRCWLGWSTRWPSMLFIIYIYKFSYLFHSCPHYPEDVSVFACVLPQVYSIPLGGMCVRQPVTMGGSGSTYVWGHIDATYQRNWNLQQTVRFVVDCSLYLLQNMNIPQTDSCCYCLQ